MNPNIFREYDIRGIAGQDLTAGDVLVLGKGLGTYLRRHNRRRVVVARDCRISSDEYARQLISGLCESGCHVTDVGVGPTPMLYFAIHHLHQEGGAMVTASHNPAEYNGFKLCLGTDSIHGVEIQNIRDIVQQGNFVTGSGSLAVSDAKGPYQDYLIGNIRLQRPLRVAVDAGNGTAGEVAVPLFKALGCEVHELYCDMDGTFPHHEADPTVAANMADLSALVRAQGLDMGFGYDGDGDRLGVVDDRGNLIHGDRIMILYAREILARKPGATFIGEVKCSQVMYDTIEKLGGRAIMWKTGHSLIKSKMKAEQAELAGEMSGHLFFGDRYLGFDDALYASCRLMEIMSATDQRLSRLLDDIPSTHNTPEIRVPCADEIKFDLVARLTDHFRRLYEVIDIDGVRILFDGGWGLVRASNTQPALVLRFEARSAARLVEIKQLVESTLAEFQTP